MHRVRHIHIVLLVCIGMFSCILNAEAAEPETEDLIKKQVVWVEPLDGIQLKSDGGRVEAPYRERRGKWGFNFAVAYSSYTPSNYGPAFGAFSYSDVYSSPTVPMIETQFTFKRNLSVGSLGVELAVGDLYNTHTDADFIGASLNLTTVRLGAVYYMDTLSPEPRFVPYISGGVYTVIYQEKLDGNSFSGNTAPSLYINAGCAFQLDWIDPISARLAYEDGGLESTYVFAEVRSYFASTNSNDPNFSNNFTWGGGLRLEF